MKITKHKIINIEVPLGKFNVTNKWCHGEVNQTYPMCALIKFIFRVTLFQQFMTNFGVSEKLKYTTSIFHGRVCLFQFPINPQICRK